MGIDKVYNPEQVERKWLDKWNEKDLFKSTPDQRPSYTIVIPPPNVTGILHMGHMLNNTIQDILIRRARLRDFNVCWVPGTDHASIATEAKVVKMLRDKGIKKSDISREKFLEYAWEWTNKHGGLILNQLKKNLKVLIKLLSPQRELLKYLIELLMLLHVKLNMLIFIYRTVVQIISTQIHK